MDLFLPNVVAWRFWKKRSIKSMAELKISVFTSSIDKNLFDKSFDLDANAFLSKGISAEALEHVNANIAHGQTQFYLLMKLKSRFYRRCNLKFYNK